MVLDGQHVTHVKVYDSDPSSVSMGYTSGYYGSYVSYGVVVYGSGWYYPPYYYYNPYYYNYPIYYPYPHSYGAGAWYNPNTGTYGRGARAYGPYGGAGFGSASSRTLRRPAAPSTTTSSVSPSAPE